VNWDLISIVIFYSLLLIIFFKYREKFTVQGKIFVLYKTKLGLKWMDKLAEKFPRFLKLLSSIGVVIGFAGMAFILYTLIKETLKLLFIPGTPPAIAPVLPGIDIPGAPDLSFWHWVITIFIAAAIHEFSHGVVARLHKVKVKSSGFAFLGPILAAFVEPEEKELSKRSNWKQMSVFAAGPFSNILLGIFILLLSGFIFSPILNSIYDGQGIIVNELVEDYPIASLDIQVPFTITQINGEDTLEVIEFFDVTSKLIPGQEVILTTDQGEYAVTPVGNPDNESVAFFGVSGLEFKNELKENYTFLEPFRGTIAWFELLFLWLFLINIGIGLFNLLPLGPVDGGRMFYALSLAVFKDEKKANKALGTASLLCLGLIIINFIPWITKLLTWIWSGIVLLIALL